MRSWQACEHAREAEWWQEMQGGVRDGQSSGMGGRRRGANSELALLLGRLGLGLERRL